MPTAVRLRMSLRILLVDDDEAAGPPLLRALASRSAEVALVKHVDALENLSGGSSFDTVVINLHRPRALGLRILDLVKAHVPSARRCLILAIPVPLSPSEVETLCSALLDDLPWGDPRVVADLMP